MDPHCVKYLHKFGWLVRLALIPGVVSQVHGDAMPAVRGISDFHHTDWKGLGAVFDIKSSPQLVATLPHHFSHNAVKQW